MNTLRILCFLILATASTLWSQPVPGGGTASAANQVTGNASLSSIDGKLTTVDTENVEIISSALPDGAATAARQPAVAPSQGTGVIDSGTQRVTIATDGPGVANLASIAVNTTDGVITGPTSVTSAATIFSVDTAGYMSAVVQVTSAGSSCTITYETSNDNSTWDAIAGQSSSNTAGLTGVTVSTATGTRYFPISARYFRARVSIYGSGTVTASVCLRKSAGPAFAQIVSTASGSYLVVGAVTQGSAVSGAPIMQAIEARTSLGTAVANGQVVRPTATVQGVAIQKPYSIPEADWSYVAASGGKTATGGVTIQAAPAANLRNYITGMQISNSGAAGTEVQIKDGAAGTVIWRGYINATTSTSVTFPTPVRQPTTATLLELDLSSGVTVAVYVNTQGYIAP